MKILMTSHYTLPHRGGIEIIIEKLSMLLGNLGHEIQIIATQIEGMEAYNTASRKFIGIKALDFLKKSGVHYPIFAPQALPMLFRATLWADVVHSQGMLYLNTVAALLFARLVKRRAVLTEHAGFVEYDRPILNLLQNIAVQTLGRLSITLSQKIIVPDTIVREILQEKFKVPPEKIVQIPLGVDTMLFHPVSACEKMHLRQALGWDSRPKILFVGNFVARKRIPLLLEALTEDMDLILCGEGTPPEHLPENVLVYPALPHTELVKLYQAADLFVVPSSVETFSIVAFEALSCGLPVIMTEDLAHLTIRQSGLVTFVAPNALSLRQAMQELLAQPEQLATIGAQSSKWVIENYSWNKSVELHLKIYLG